MNARKLAAGMAGLSAALLLSLLAAPADAVRLAGKFKKGVYTAPEGLFVLQSPLGAHPFIYDSFSPDAGVGSIAFSTDIGQLYGVVYGPNLDPLADMHMDEETATAILRNWFRDAIFPAVFSATFPGSSILRDEGGTFDGQPAWIAAVYMPGASPLIGYDPETRKSTREDSWRGIVVLQRGQRSYALMYELNDGFVGHERFKFDPAATDWNAFVPKLAEFYRGMQFTLAPP